MKPRHPLVCCYCHRRIRWYEGKGWLRVDEEGDQIVGTNDCLSRSDSGAGHALTLSVVSGPIVVRPPQRL